MPFAALLTSGVLKYVAGGAAILLAIGAVWLWVAGKDHAVASARAAQAQAEAKAAAADQRANAAAAQANVTAAAAQGATDAAAKEVHLTVTAQEATRAIQSAPGAATPLPSAGFDAWRSSIERLRSQAASTPDSANPDSGKPTGAVPST